MVELGQVVVDDVGVVRITLKKILMVLLGGVKMRQRHHLGDDWPGKSLAPLKPGDIGLRLALLLFVGVEDYRAVLGPGIRTLPVELGRVVSNKKENPQQLIVRD